MAIAEPTSAAFLRQSGSNLLLAGHREEAALGVMAAALLAWRRSIRRARPPPGGTRRSSTSSTARGPTPPRPASGAAGRRCCRTRSRWASVRESAELLAEIAAEVARRQQEGQDKAPPVYLLIYNLGRFRDLRKEDEFSFGGSRRAASRPARPSNSPRFSATARPWASTP